MAFGCDMDVRIIDNLSDFWNNYRHKVFDKEKET